MNDKVLLGKNTNVGRLSFEILLFGYKNNIPNYISELIRNFVIGRPYVEYPYYKKYFEKRFGTDKVLKKFSMLFYIE